MSEDPRTREGFGQNEGDVDESNTTLIEDIRRGTDMPDAGVYNEDVDDRLEEITKDQPKK